MAYPGGYYPNNPYPDQQQAYPVYPPGVYPPQDMPPQAYPPQAYPPQGQPQYVYPTTSSTGYPPQGYPPQGQQPYPQQPYPGQPGVVPPAQPYGFVQAYPPQAVGYPPQGQQPYPPQGQQAYPQQPYPVQQGVPPATQPYPQQPYPGQPGVPPATQPYPQQPYPGQPGAPPTTQPYPQQPYPGQPGAPPTTQPYPQQPYPGQPQAGYPGNPSLSQSSTPVPLTNNPDQDADVLYRAMKGFGTDEATLISVLCKRTYPEVVAICKVYITKYGKDLGKALHSEISGNFLKVMLGLLIDPLEYQAQCLYDGMKGIGTNEDVLIETLVGKTNAEFNTMNQFYEKDHKKSIRHAVESETSGDLKKFLVGLTEPRPEGTPVSPESAQVDAERLYNAGEGRLGTDEATFIEIFTKRSYAHLREVFRVYETIHKHHSMHQAVSGEFSGHIKQGLLAMVTFVRNPGEFYAEELMRAMKGVGTNDAKLVRLIVGQRQHMPAIKAAFAAKYEKTLWQFVKSETSGDYLKSLLEIIGN